jgi:hypothetical protein
VAEQDAPRVADELMKVHEASGGLGGEIGLVSVKQILTIYQNGMSEWMTVESALIKGNF